MQPRPRATTPPACRGSSAGWAVSGRFFEPVIGPTVDTLADVAPATVVPAHCTGWKATSALAARLPEAFIQSSVGTTHVL